MTARHIPAGIAGRDMISALFPAAPPRTNSFGQKCLDAKRRAIVSRITESSRVDRLLDVRLGAATRSIGRSFGWRVGVGGRHGCRRQRERTEEAVGKTTAAARNLILIGLRRNNPKIR